MTEVARIDRGRPRLVEAGYETCVRVDGAGARRILLSRTPEGPVGGVE